MSNGEWHPKTELGRRVKSGEVTSLLQILEEREVIMEPEIVTYLMPELNEKDYQEVLNVNMVQRMTDSGRRVKFNVVAVVGNKNGFVGLGQAKSSEVGPAIRKAIEVAKLNIIPVRRGCGSWECNCGKLHTIPFEVKGKIGSVEVTLKPGPRGLGLVIGDVGKKILHLAGIEDVWSDSKGKTRTTINFAKAVFKALSNANKISIQKTHVENIGIKTGKVE